MSGFDAVDEAVAAAARAIVLACPSYTVAEADAVLGQGGAAWEIRARRLLAVDDAGALRVPAFQLDKVLARVVPIVGDVNLLLGAKDDPWGVASWWLSPSGTLADGVCPADVVHTDPGLLRRLAHDLAHGV